VAVTTPLDVVFGRLGSLWVMALSGVISLLFAADIVRRFSRPIEIDGRPVADRAVIRHHYLRGWFTVDLLAAIPFGLLAMAPGIAGSVLAATLRLLGLTRILRVARILALQRDWRARTSLNPALLRLSFFVFWVLVLAHWIACGWVALGGPANDTHGVHPYLQALYWTITTLTTVGYGDITPHGPGQVLFAMVVMLLGVAMYGYVIGNVSNLLANIDVIRSQHLSKIELVGNFLRDRDVPRGLQARVRDYYNYLWASRMGQETKMLEDLPVSLRIEIALHLNRQILRKVPLFENASEGFLRELVLHLEPAVFTPGDTILRRGEIGNRIYFIHRGNVQVLSGDERQVVATLGDGDFFGELALLTRQPRSASIRAVDYCNLYTLEKREFDLVLDKFPEFAEEVRRVAAHRRGDPQPERG